MSKTEVLYRDVAPGAAENAQIAASGAISFAHPELLPEGVTGFRPAVLERNAWVLDGRAEFPEEHTAAYWSDGLSDENCVLDPAPVITANFTQMFSSLGMTLIFNEETGEYASLVNIRWYRDSTLLADRDFTPDAPRYFCVQLVEAYNRIEVTLKKTSLPFRRVRLNRMIFGVHRLFTMREIRKASVTNEMSALGSELPVSAFNLSIDSRDELGYMFQLKQALEIYNDGSQLGSYYIDEHTRLSASLYDLKCSDAFGVLDEEPYPGKVVTAQSAKALFTEIVNDDFDIVFSAPDITLDGLIEPCTRREALQQVLFAWGAAAATDGGSSIRVFTLDDTPKDIDPDRIYIGASVDISSIVTRVELTAHSYKESANGSIEVGGKKYEDIETVYTITNPLVTAADKQRVIRATGTLVSPGIAQTVAQRVYDYYQRRNGAKAKIVWRGELLGACISLPLQWGGETSGNIEKMEFTISNTVAANVEARGE